MGQNPSSIDNLLACMAARRGHFVLESGHHGDLWLDVDRLFVRSALLQPFVAQLAQKLADYDIEVICGPLTGGAFLAQSVAQLLGVDFVFASRVEPPGSSGLFPVAYPIPPKLAEFVHDRRVAVVNDVINAGSAVRGTLASLHSLSGRCVVMGSLLALGDSAGKIAAEADVPLTTLFSLSNDVWRPEECPMCRENLPLIE
jgi:orotate phosphoribosyltransferase